MSEGQLEARSGSGIVALCDCECETVHDRRSQILLERFLVAFTVESLDNVQINGLCGLAPDFSDDVDSPIAGDIEWNWMDAAGRQAQRGNTDRM
jgi:hypothetical protein